MQHNAACGRRKHLHINLARQQLQHPEADYSGQLLNDMCQATNPINLTGATCNALPAAASFISTSTSTSTNPSNSPSNSNSNSKRKPSRI